MNIIKIFVSVIIIFVAMILTSFIPAKDETKIDIEKVFNSPNMNDLINAEIERIEQEKAEELIKEKRKHARNTVVSRGTTRSVPRSNTSNKTYMNYKKITNKSSKQYQLQQNADVYTDEEGFRKINDKFMIAIGTYFQAEVGQEVEVELSSGNKFSAVVGDIKANKDTVDNMQHKTDKSIVEFIVDNDKLENVVRKMGDCSYSMVNNFQGGVVSITVLENSIIE